jgi:hypothetical protein
VSATYLEELDERLGAVLSVDFRTERGEVVDYTVILMQATSNEIEAIRVYDSTHGYNEMHRYLPDSGKQSGALFHSGTLGEGMRAAIDDVKRGYVAMIEGRR